MKREISLFKKLFQLSLKFINHLEKFNPVPHIKKHELIKGDATKTIKIFKKIRKQ